MQRLVVLLLAALVLPPPCHARSIHLHRKALVAQKDVFITHQTTKIPTTSKSKKSKKTPKLDCTVKHKKITKSASPTISPSPSSSPAPNRSGKGKSSREDCPTMISACSLLEMGLAEFDTFHYLVDMQLNITEPVEDVLQTLHEYLDEALGRALSGCYEFDVRRRRRRRLQETGIMKIDLQTTQDTQAPCGTFTDGTCANIDIAMEVTHDEGDPDIIRSALLNTIAAGCSDIAALPGVSAALDPCASLLISGEETQSGNGTDGDGGDGSGTDGGDTSTGGGDGGGTDTTQKDGAPADDDDDDDGSPVVAVQTQASEEGVRRGGYVSIAVLAVVLLIVVLFLVRRRREYMLATQHKYLVDDGGDDETDTYLKDSDTDSQGTQGRQVHVVGEADSVFSGWTGFTGGRRNKPTDHGGLYPRQYSDSFDEAYMNQDVHKCSSATCELCERKRREGVQFVPAQMPSHSSVMPANASRRYTTGDTVVL